MNELRVWISDREDPYFHLSLEDYLVRTQDFSLSPILIIYINQTSVILGKNQNIFKEINYPYCIENQIPIARRISGGGTVVHDLGNINFAFFYPYEFNQVNKYDNSVGLIVDFLNSIGIHAYQNERNAIVTKDGFKLSGSAQFSCLNGILSHLTLLYDSNIDEIKTILSQPKYQVDVKSSDSHPSPIVNLIEKTNLPLNAFLDLLIEYLKSRFQIIEYNPNQNDLDYKLNKEYLKYSDWSYIYDTCNTCKIYKDKSFVELKHGRIESTYEGLDLSLYRGKRLDLNDLDLNDPLWLWLKS